MHVFSFYSSGLSNYIMDKGLMAGILGRFLQIYAFLIAVPAVLTLLYAENAINFYLFTGTSVICFIAGTAMTRLGSTGEPSVKEAMFLTVVGWVLAIIIGAIPISYYISGFDAVFEAASGLTTTGISVVMDPAELPYSILFWRSFMQWIGGLGILTFFIAVIKKSGGVSQRLFSAEAHKTDPGSIRPSVTKSVKDLWRVYGFLTTTLIGLFIALEMRPFDAVIHAFSTLSTGGFSSQAASFANYSPEIKAVATVFMFIGSMNFVLIYRALKSDYRPLRNNSEFIMYIAGFMAITLMLFNDFIGQTSRPLLDAFFQSAAFISSTGFSTVDIMIAAPAVQIVLLGVLFIGGSLGSTSGGLKIFRLITMFKLLKTRLRDYSLPKSAVNSVKIDGEILESSALKTISVLFFAWIVFAFAVALILVGIEGYSFKGAISVAFSSMGNMGPVFIDSMLAEASTLSKLVLVVSMIAGRLELLPLLAVFNTKMFKN